MERTEEAFKVLTLQEGKSFAIRCVNRIIDDCYKSDKHMDYPRREQDCLYKYFEFMLKTLEKDGPSFDLSTVCWAVAHLVNATSPRSGYRPALWALAHACDNTPHYYHRLFMASMFLSKEAARELDLT